MKHKELIKFLIICILLIFILKELKWANILQEKLIVGRVCDDWGQISHKYPYQVSCGYK